ncbi:MAG: helix-hairpin-helix domain-containing protein [Phycisphaeraceae bacterium]
MPSQKGAPASERSETAGFGLRARGDSDTLCDFRPAVCAGRGTRRWGRRGFALLAVLVVTMMTSLIVVSLMFRVRAEEASHAAAGAGEQSRAVAMSGLAMAFQITRDNAHADQLWRDNPESFQDQLVMDDGQDQWYFTLYAPPAEEGSAVRYGLTDEASKLNLHRVEAVEVAELPELSLAVAERIKDFLGSESAGTSLLTADDLDPDAETEADAEADASPEDDLAGAFDSAFDDDLFDDDDSAETDDESDANIDEADGTSIESAGSSTSSSGGGSAGSVDLEGMVSTDHLLAVQDVNLALLYGRDEMVEAEADDEPRTISAVDLPPDNAVRLEQRGLRDFATLLSYEPNVDRSGQPRVNLNDPEADLESLEASEELIAYLEAVWRSDEPLESVAALLNARTMPNEDDEDEEYASPIAVEDLPDLLDRCTTTDEPVIRGRVNVNTASLEVLTGLPGVDEALAETIVANREGLDETQRESIAWLLEDDLLSVSSFVALSPYLTTRSYQFHVQVFAYAVPSRRYRVIEAVIDIAGPTPRVVYLRDLTRLGPPLPMEDNGGSGGTLARTRP